MVYGNSGCYIRAAHPPWKISRLHTPARLVMQNRIEERRYLMKRKILSILVVAGLILGLAVIPAQAATEEQIEASIQKGLDWLVPQQNDDGSWGDRDRVARTGLAVVKLEDRAFELGFDSPFDPNYQYSQNVIDGLDYIFTQAGTYGAGTGICFDIGFYETYSTGIAMMAIAASRTPDRVVTTGLYATQTYQSVVQGNVDFFAWSQNPDGGWIYWSGFGNSDNSNTGYAVLGLRYAEDFGCVIPAIVKPGLNNWINYIQTNPGDPGHDASTDGGSGYTGPGDWVNCLKTGNLLFEMAFFGDDMSTARAQRAIAYLVRHWNDTGACGTGWKDTLNCQAAYCVMKGLESMVIIEPEDFGGIDWFDEMSTEIVDNQHDDGYWPWDCWGDEMLATVWALLTLERVVPNRPPDCSEAYADPACLWPPNHKFVDVAIMGVTDPDGDPVTITITEITSDEATATDKGSGGAKHSPDADGIGTDTASVRAERSGTADGRVYVISFTASDGRGGECEGSVMVKVPHDQSDNTCPAVDSGQIYDATQMN